MVLVLGISKLLVSTSAVRYLYLLVEDFRRVADYPALPRCGLIDCLVGLAVARSVALMMLLLLRLSYRADGYR